jgi:hypothetical protein
MTSEFGLFQDLGTKQTCWSEGAVQTQRNLGYWGPASNLLPNARIGAVQSWRRQQVAGLRPAQAKDSRRLSRRDHGVGPNRFGRPDQAVRSRAPATRASLASQAPDRSL